MTLVLDVNGSYDALANHSLRWQHNRMTYIKWDGSVDNAPSNSKNTLVVNVRPDFSERRGTFKSGSFANGLKFRSIRNTLSTTNEPVYC